MAGVYKKPSDRARGKAGKWTLWYVDETGKRRKRAGFTDRAKTQELANHLEAEARRVREGIIEPEERSRREGALRPVADHVDDYRRSLIAKGNTAKHANHQSGAVGRVLESAGVASIADLSPDRIQEALGRMREATAKGKPGASARTVNHALAAVKAFACWLEGAGRIRKAPPALLAMDRYNEAKDRRRVRRAITFAEIGRLLAAAESGPDHYLYGPTKSKVHKIPITGPERAALYRLAMGTGFRADELRTLTPERFALDGDAPTITVLACYSKNGKEAVQPITPELAEGLRPFLEGREPGRPIFTVPEKTAKMLRRDLAAAGIPYQDDRGRTLDFHALRHSYITHLVASGVNPKIVQTLARHSTITLTLDRYTHLDAEDVRAALSSAIGKPDPWGANGAQPSPPLAT